MEGQKNLLQNDQRSFSLTLSSVLSWDLFLDCTIILQGVPRCEKVAMNAYFGRMCSYEKLE